MGVKRLVALLCLFALVGCRHEPPAYESRYTPPPPEPAYAPATPPQWALFDPASVNRALEGDRPYTISVLGDSTGNYVDEWVHILARHIAAAYGRTVAVRDWDVEQNAYQVEQEHLYGTGVPVTVWNASSAGKSAEYSLENYPKMMPQPTDLTIISHGHNSPNGAAKGVVRLVDMAYRNTTPGGGVMVVLQNPRTDKFADQRTKVTDQLRQMYSGKPDTGVVLLDVNSAFTAAPDLPALLRPDGIHPNAAGSQVWADAVVQQLGLR